MGIYISSYLDAEATAYFRDFARLFNKHKRSLYFRSLEELHFDYKFLGDSLPDIQIDEIRDILEEFAAQKKISTFTYKLDKIHVGRQYEHMPHQISTNLSHSSELHQFFRFMSEIVAGVEGTYRKKNVNSSLGVINLAAIRPNAGKKDREEIIHKIELLPAPPEIRIDNISVLELDVFKGKPRSSKLHQIRLS